MLGLHARRALLILLAVASPHRVFALGDRVRFLSCLGDNEPELVDIDFEQICQGSAATQVATGQELPTVNHPVTDLAPRLPK